MKNKKFKVIVENLKPFRPQKVILFGSHAWGKPAKDSDIDLLIIKETKIPHYKRIPRARRYLHNLDFAFDILVMSPKEIKRRLKLGDFFIKEIIKKGITIYEEK